MNILKAQLILHRYGTDTIMLVTDKPDAIEPGDMLCLQFHAPRDQGADFLQRHFPAIPVQLIDARPKEAAPKFARASS